MSEISFQITTFGCKANQYDSQLWRTTLEGAGLRYDEDKADLYLVNTCSVTLSAEQQARQTVRKIIRNNPSAKSIIIGCYGQLSAETLSRIDGVGLVLGRHSSEAAGQLLNWLGIGQDKVPSRIKTFHGHTRAFIKVQDGCNHRCSYCIVPLARGASRSRPLDEILSEAQNLTASGHRELVVTGIRLGDFKPSLGILLRSLKDIPGLDRIRLSSLEPDDLSDDLIETMQGIPLLARHLHLPLQSGCDSILKKMNRPYSVAYYRELMDKLRRAMPGITIGSDIIVGFPGETEEHFGQSVRNIKEMGFTHLHIFTYSKRPGTKAALMAGQIPEDIKKERLHRLKDIHENLQQEYLSGLAGKSELVLVESSDRGLWSGFGEHYHKVYFRTDRDMKNKMVRVRLSEPYEQGLMAEPIEGLDNPK
ncbi:MAG: tRNA (N(6)-L-threonylcarbamoyladenosine(37)-C(2))-methylthiotransferase MtaB [Candidatus Edwardsbacteria bacterium]|nr:tRNA (N(6)-L-threonylcarbamoyladenosine(37)-C(2))-methylthiotransferase MtaB [Candidatus Edwardsbacteria bacterium]MBU2463711.1 tRNA (N(6)-L-threonylcarbamoyladenosine(37)-C(2))-methylthiotransferase MtaB [Candidatus Edwardsbacteria bacterium]MBU2594650.1 tRNA (N(6)-L-threonylcarbamoyladenosine(37)-C(2))-methylthiotransferase MtaB [Candidatus Edwardsbacteria bacterium]